MYLIDGNNLIGHTKSISYRDPQARQQIVDRIANLLEFRRRKATIVFDGRSDAYWEYSLIANSGSSTNWNSVLGSDWGHNLDADPRFLSGLDPASAPVAGGDYALRISSPAGIFVLDVEFPESADQKLFPAG